LVQALRWFVSDTPAHHDVGAHQKQICELMLRFGLQRLVVTRGAKGYIAYGVQGETVVEGSAPSVGVIDTVGAGDAFFAVLLIGELAGWPLADTLSRAARFAANVCTLQGAVASTPDFYQTWRHEFAINSRAQNDKKTKGGMMPSEKISA
jgi:fructokinase